MIKMLKKIQAYVVEMAAKQVYANLASDNDREALRTEEIMSYRVRKFQWDGGLYFPSWLCDFVEKRGRLDVFEGSHLIFLADLDSEYAYTSWHAKPGDWIKLTDDGHIQIISDVKKEEEIMAYVKPSTITKEQIQDRCTDISTLLKLKNGDYGDSFMQQFEEFGMTSSIIRLSDKLNRLKTLSKKPAGVSESIDDTLRDMAGYAIMTLAAREVMRGGYENA